jgi:hypothetical protein
MDGPVWEYKDGASDCFGFLVQAGIRLNPDTLPRWPRRWRPRRSWPPPGELCRGANAYTGRRWTRRSRPGCSGRPST